MATPAAALAALTERPALRWLGLMSGTSCDGVDAALVEVVERTGARPSELPRARVLGGNVVPFDHAFRAALLDALTTPASLADAAPWDTRLAERFAGAALEVAERYGGADAIALSGHTFVHLGRAATRATLQLGNPALVAERCRLPVVAGFRAADLAAGGEGAPLVPAGDRILFGDPERDVAVLNLGGIANITWLPRGGGEPRALDCGPCNLVLNEAIRVGSGGAIFYDPNGEVAARGRAHPKLTDRWLEHEFFRGDARSTGREEFGEAWIAEHAGDLEPLGLEDRLATLVLWIARAIGLAIERLAPRVPTETAPRLLAGGGGAHHRSLVAAVARVSGLAPEVLSAERHGVSADLREAAAFALLGNEWIRGRAGSFPGTTGVRTAGAIGSLWLPVKSS